MVLDWMMTGVPPMTSKTSVRQNWEADSSIPHLSPHQVSRPWLKATEAPEMSQVDQAKVDCLKPKWIRNVQKILNHQPDHWTIKHSYYWMFDNFVILERILQQTSPGFIGYAPYFCSVNMRGTNSILHWVVFKNCIIPLYWLVSRKSHNELW